MGSMIPLRPQMELQMGLQMGLQSQLSAGNISKMLRIIALFLITETTVTLIPYILYCLV